METESKHGQDSLGADSHTATREFRRQTEVVGQDLRELGRIGKDAAREKLDETRKTAAELYDQGRQKAGDLESQVLNHVREKPVTSLLIAAGVGLLFGAFMSRR